MARESKENYQLPPASVLARFAVFVNGLARGAILPFGPTLVYRLLNGTATVTSRTWSSISFNLAVVFVSFTVGQSVGALLPSKLPQFKQNVHHYVARLGGATISLHLFSCVVALSSVFWLVVIRFFSAVCVGIVCSITDPSSMPVESTTTINNSGTPDIENSSNPRPAIGTESAKVFLTGFSTSLLSGGISYWSLSAEDPIPSPVTAISLSSTGSLLFVVVTGIIFETSLKRAFALATQPDNLDPGSSSGPGQNITRLVRRFIGGKHLQQRVSFKDTKETILLGSPAWQSNVSSSRPRAASYNSAATEGSDYFDCQSDLSDIDMDHSELQPRPEGDDVAQYVDKICCYADGSPAYVTPGDAASIVPRNYLENCRGNHKKAMQMWQETQKWRRDRQVWKIHTMPNKFFKEIKRQYPHNIGGHSKSGLPCIYEQPGKMNIKALFRDSGCTVDDMVHHFIFCTEYFSRLCASEELRRVAGKENEPFNTGEFGIVVVMDIQGTGLQFLNGDIMTYLKRVSDINAIYYPLSITRVLVVNCPFWAGIAASTLKKVLPESVKLDLLTADCVDGLRQYIDDDQIPKEYGGSSPFPLGQHPYEKRLQELAEEASLGDIEANNYESPIVLSTSTDILAVDDTLATVSTTSSKVATFAPENGVPTTAQKVRRRAGMASESLASEPNADDPETYLDTTEGVGVNSGAFISFFLASWSGAHGAIEIAIPLWLSSPTRFGGMGYTPFRSGITMFGSTLVLLSVLTTTTSLLVSSMPRKAPLHAMRLALTAESLILFIMTITPLVFAVEHNKTIITVSIVIMFTVGGIANLLGRSSSLILRSMVFDGLPPWSGENVLSWSAFLSIETFIAETASGRATTFLCVVSELFGISMVSLIWALSINREKPSKYDGSLCMLLPALSTGFLYFASFFVQLNAQKKSLNPATTIFDSADRLELGTLRRHDMKSA